MDLRQFILAASLIFCTNTILVYRIVQQEKRIDRIIKIVSMLMEKIDDIIEYNCD